MVCFGGFFVVSDREIKIFDFDDLKRIKFVGESKGIQNCNCYFRNLMINQKSAQEEQTDF